MAQKPPKAIDVEAKTYILQSIKDAMEERLDAQCPNHRIEFLTKDRMRIKNLLGLETPTDKLEVHRCKACGEVKIYYMRPDDV